jgi:glycosyltransferase involved in cell wall biosynthesis
MRIIYISTYPPTECGIATYTQYLQTEVRSYGIEVFVLSQYGAKGDNVFEVYKPDDKDIAYNLFHIVSKLTPDLIHIQHEFGLFGHDRGVQIIDFLIRCKMADIPVITTLHTVYLKPAWKEQMITSEILRLSKEIIVHEAYQKEALINEYKCLKEIHIIPHGVRKTETIKSAKELLGLSSKKVVLLAGYFRTSKHFEKLIDIFPNVLARVPNAVLLIACRLRVAEYNEKRKQLLRMMRFSDNKEHIRILKGQFPQKTLDHIMSAADVVVMPYSAGAQSGMLAQFATHNIPLVSSDLLSFKIWNKETGGGLTSYTNEDYVNNICKILNDDVLAEQMRKNIQKSNEHRFWSEIAKKHLHIYENIVVKEDDIAEYFYVPDTGQ